MGEGEPGVGKHQPIVLIEQQRRHGKASDASPDATSWMVEVVEQPVRLVQQAALSFAETGDRGRSSSDATKVPQNAASAFRMIGSSITSTSSLSSTLKVS